MLRMEECSGWRFAPEVGEQFHPDGNCAICVIS